MSTEDFDRRRNLFERLAFAMATDAHLSAPAFLYISTEGGCLTLRCVDGATNDVDHWATTLGFPPAVLDGHTFLTEGGEPAWRKYESSNPGWQSTTLADIWCVVLVDSSNDYPHEDLEASGIPVPDGVEGRPVGARTTRDGA